MSGRKRAAWGEGSRNSLSSEEWSPAAKKRLGEGGLAREGKPQEKNPPPPQFCRLESSEKEEGGLKATVGGGSKTRLKHNSLDHSADWERKRFAFPYLRGGACSNNKRGGGKIWS